MRLAKNGTRIATFVIGATAIGGAVAAVACGGSTAGPPDASTDSSTLVESGPDGADAGSKDARTEASLDAGRPDVKLDYDGGAILSYGVLSADYSRALDRVLLTGTDEALHLLDPHTLDDETIPVQGAVYASVSPDGLDAAVAQEAQLQVAYVDLSSRSILTTFPLGQNPPGAVLFAGNSTIYAFPTNPLPGDGIMAIDIATGQLTGTRQWPGSYVPGSISDDETAMVLTTAGSCETLVRFYLQDGGIASGASTAMHSPCCGAWITPDASSAYLGCGGVLNVSTMQITASLSSASKIASVDFHSSNGTAAVLAAPSGSDAGGEATELQTYDEQSLALSGKVPLPPLDINGQQTATFGLYVFHDAAGTGTFAIVAGPQSAFGKPGQLTYAIVAL